MLRWLFQHAGSSPQATVWCLLVLNVKTIIIQLTHILCENYLTRPECLAKIIYFVGIP